MLSTRAGAFASEATARSTSRSGRTCNSGAARGRRSSCRQPRRWRKRASASAGEQVTARPGRHERSADHAGHAAGPRRHREGLRGRRSDPRAARARHRRAPCSKPAATSSSATRRRAEGVADRGRRTSSRGGRTVGDLSNCGRLDVGRHGAVCRDRRQALLARRRPAHRHRPDGPLRGDGHRAERHHVGRLSTAACVLGPEKGGQLVKSTARRRSSAGR